MKRILGMFSIIGLLLSACEPIIDTPSNVDESNLLITTKIIKIGAEGGVGEVEYTIQQPVEDVALEATTSTEWITDIVTAETITFSVMANTTTEQRLGLITISYGAEEYTIGVQQSGKESSTSSVLISFEQRKITIPANGGKSSVGYTMSGAEEGAIPEASTDAEWISDISVDEENVSFVVAKNTSTERREAKILVSYDSAEASLTVIQEGAVNEVVLSASTTVVRVGEEVTFSVEYAGEDVTSEATIHDYYTNEEISNPASFSEVGDRALYAKYDNQKSKLLSINIFPESTPDFAADSDPENYNFKYRMLLIDHTGTDCGYCPLMMQSVKELEADPAFNDYFNIAMAHSYNTSDPAYSSTALTIRYYYQKTLGVLTGFPTLTYNYQYGDSAGNNMNYIKSNFNKLKKESQDAAVALTTRLDGDKIVISASLKSKEARRYKFNILLLEDDIYGQQYGATYSWMNYHNNAIRASYATISKEDITGDEWGYVNAKSTQHKVFEFPIEDSRCVKSNCKILVIISALDASYGNKYEVVNTTMCELNSSTPFEYR